jgi:hypothetical protein
MSTPAQNDQRNSLTMIVFSVRLQPIEGVRGYWIQEPNDDIYIRGKIPEYSLYYI